MWKQFWEWTQQVIVLTQDQKSIKEELKAQQADMNQLRNEVRDLTTAFQRLAYELKRTQENEANERKLLALQLENQLLRFERRLPPAPPQNSSGE